jgi:hypothetical protein
MKKIIQKTAVLIVAALFIMATGGFSIYHHFCYCAGESSASIYMETTCGHDHAAIQEPASCCSASADHQESCCANQPQEKQADDCHKDDCCNTSSIYLKISDNFTVTLEKISFKFVVSFIQIMTGIELQPESQTSVFLNTEFNDTSPPLYGTDLLHNIQQLKIAHFLA